MVQHVVYDKDFVIPGWNEYVAEKHHLARNAFKAWVLDGRLKQGSAYISMKRTRAQFKLALRYCKQHDEALRADACAHSLAAQDYKQFWSSVKKANNSKANAYANFVGGCNGPTQITELWFQHFKDLYNCVPDDGDRERFLQRVNFNAPSQHDCVIYVRDVADALGRQKRGKAIGCDGIAMDAFVNGGGRLTVHLCMLFNLFIKHCYMPKSFMQCVIIPLVKCKSGNLADVNNYRAIAVSTAISKLFEHVLSYHLECFDGSDAYQFGFTSGLSTSLCTNVLKQTVEYYSERGSHVFACFIDFTKAFDRVNYWKLFNMLLDDKCNINFVRTLAFWYSQQEACVRW